MEANELRIGNYLLYRDENICQVSNIGNYFETSFNGLSYGSDNINDYKPIPLTEELLLKCGFYKAQYLEHIFQININGLYFAFDEAFEGEKDENIVGDFDECVTIRIPKYLHQLQNIYFALTGKELEINL